MDFASLMSAEINKKRPATSQPTTTTPTSKYQKRSDIEAARKAAYLASQATETQRAIEKAEAKRLADIEAEAARVRIEEKRRKLAEESRIRRESEERSEERKRRKRLGLPETQEEGEKEEVLGDDDVGDEELRGRLRGIGEPAVLFGESHKGRLRRWQRLSVVMTNGPIPTCLELVEEKEMKVDGVPKDEEGRKYLFRQLASYFTMVLREWEAALAKEGRGESFASKAAFTAMEQSKENMTPLFRKFEKGDIDDDVLVPTVEIVKAAQEKRYVDANDGYLRLSIGKAAWPIGVTMVGIHERSAREKIGGNEKGHVMGDEVTRKFLQAIKRCLSFAQVRWPPEDIRQLMG